MDLSTKLETLRVLLEANEKPDTDKFSEEQLNFMMQACTDNIEEAYQSLVGNMLALIIATKENEPDKIKQFKEQFVNDVGTIALTLDSVCDFWDVDFLKALEVCTDGRTEFLTKSEVIEKDGKKFHKLKDGETLENNVERCYK